MPKYLVRIGTTCTVEAESKEAAGEEALEELDFTFPDWDEQHCEVLMKLEDEYETEALRFIGSAHTAERRWMEEK